MSSPTTTDLCRVVLVTPHRTLDVALPARVPLADLMPVLVQRATVAAVPQGPARGPGRRGRGAGRGRGLTGEGDWVLQRLGSAALDEELTPAALEIHEGEMLYLRPRDSQLPPAHFDDLIDGLATGVRGRPDRWRDSMTAVLFRTFCLVAIGVCFVLLLDPTFTRRAAVAAVLAGGLVLGAMMASRALDDVWAALTLGLSAIPFAALSGYLVPPAPSGLASAGPNLLCAAVAASVAAMLAMVVIGQHQAVFLAVLVTTASAALAALLTGYGITPAQAAGVVVVVALTASTLAPTAAFRLARLRLPQLPTSATDLADDVEPYPAQQVMTGAVLADNYLTCLLVAVGLLCTAGVVILVRSGSGRADALVLAVSGVLLIRSRALTSAWQRGATLTPAVCGLALLTIRLGTGTDPLRRVSVLATLLVTAVVMLAFSHTMPGRRLLPYWGRLADFLEYVLALAMVLLLLGIFDAYETVRGLAG